MTSVKSRSLSAHNVWAAKWRGIKKHPLLYLMIFFPIAYVFIFSYIPMYGILLAFKEYRILDGIAASPWVGLKHFQTFFSSPSFVPLLWNTISLSVYTTIAGFIPPILLAIMINECRNRFFKKSVQLITYAPHFLSTVILVGVVTQVFSYTGIVNNILSIMGIEPINFMGEASMFKHLYVWSGVWQNMGYNAIMYIAALAGINPDLYEAASVEGTNIWQKIWYIDLPSIAPTIIIMLILSSANVLSVGFEKVYLMQNTLNQSASDVIATYVYRTGLVNMQYDYSTAVGLFQSVVSLFMISIVNKIAQKVSETSLW